MDFAFFLRAFPVKAPMGFNLLRTVEWNYQMNYSKLDETLWHKLKTSQVNTDTSHKFILDFKLCANVKKDYISEKHNF